MCIILFSDFSQAASPLKSLYKNNILEDYDYTNTSVFSDIESSFKVSISCKHKL